VDNGVGPTKLCVKNWARWLSVFASIPLLALCVLVPILNGERVYRFLIEFGSKFSTRQWAATIACRWVAWVTLIIAVAQIGMIVALVFRPRRRILIASYVGIAILTGLFLVWVYFMAPSLNLLNAVSHP
jgi:hypothetical protein